MNFIEKYNHKKNIRFPFFKKAIEISIKRKFKIFVETGTSRGKKKFLFFKKKNWKDGMSTLMFADFTNQINGELHSCDISKENIDNARSFTSKFRENTFFYINDSVIFLKDFKKKIDFLYLDSFDGHDTELASIHQLNEAKASIDKLGENSLVLLDDKGAKTLYSKDYFVKHDFNVLAETENQLLLSKML